MRITLVTGNKNKLREWQRMLPIGWELRTIAVDLAEIQTNDLEALITDKVKRAFAEVNGPVIVEDIAAGLDALQGLPGPFIKFFEEKLGEDALFQLANNSSNLATVYCVVAFYDGIRLITVTSKVHGTVTSARGKNGFGFDVCFVPDGQVKTYAEMTADQKDTISHRSLAIRELASKLKYYKP